MTSLRIWLSEQDNSSAASLTVTCSLAFELMRYGMVTPFRPGGLEGQQEVRHEDHAGRVIRIMAVHFLSPPMMIENTGPRFFLP